MFSSDSEEMVPSDKAGYSPEPGSSSTASLALFSLRNLVISSYTESLDCSEMTGLFPLPSVPPRILT